MLATSRSILVASALLAAIAGGSLALGSPRRASGASSSSVVPSGSLTALAGLAGELTHAPDVVADTSMTVVDARLLPNRAAVSEYVAQKQGSVPLAPGGSFSGIQWKALGLLAPEQVQSFLEYDAACSWYRYVWRGYQQHDPVAVAVGNRVIGDIPQWPTFRVNEKGVRAQGVADSVAQGSLDALQAEVTGDCAT